MYRATVPTRAVASTWSDDSYDVVDFAAIVPLSTCEGINCAEEGGCDDCADSWWTPRTADLLHWVADLELDMALGETGLRDWGGESDETSDGEDFHIGWVLEMLPRAVAVHATPQWVARFLGCYADLMLRMEDGNLPFPRCTGEEMALHLILDAAADRLADYSIEDSHDPDDDMLVHGNVEVQNGLPRTPADYNIDLLRDVLFEDHDVLMLFDVRLDGIESDPLMVDAMGLANLHFNDWFTPFRDDFPVVGLEAGFHRDITPGTDKAVA